MKLKRIVLGMLAAASIVSLPASAGVIGMADLAVLSLGVVTPARQPVIGGIVIKSDQRTGSAASNFNGVQGTGAGDGSLTGNSTSGSTVDVKYRCAGDCGPTMKALYAGGIQAVGTVEPQPENNLTTHVKTANVNYALGDMTISGTAVSGPGANGLTRADSSVANANNIGGASANINNTVRATSTTKFTLLNPDPNGPNPTTTTLDAAFSLTYDVFRKVWIDPLMPANESGIASAGTTFVLSLTSSDDPLFTTLTWRPDALNDTKGAFSSADNSEFEQTGTIFSETRTLHAGKTYILTVTQSAISSASQVPEPGSMILVGLGLAALGSVARRRRA